jgi:type IV pilus assembly protein PilC
MAFAYTALDARTGREVKKVIEAPSAAEAALALRRQELFPIQLEAMTVAVKAPARLSLGFTRRRDVVIFFRQLALMLRAGLTLLQALDVAREQCPRPGLARAIGRARTAVESGRSFAEALLAERRIFPEVASRLVAAAEASGELDLTLDRVALHLERGLELRSSLIASLIYPAIVLLVASGVVLFLVTRVIPIFARFLERRHVPLPAATRFLLDASAVIREHGLLLALSGIGLTLGFVFLRTTPRGKRALDRALLSVPLVGGVLRAAVMAQVGETFATLLRGGVTLVEALRLLSKVVLNSAVASQLEAAAEGVLGGSDLAAGLRHATIPPLVPQVVAVGERTGALEDVLEEVGRFYDAELRARLKQLTTLFEPMVIALVGGLVGFVYFAFFQALLQLASRGH